MLKYKVGDIVKTPNRPWFKDRGYGDQKVIILYHWYNFGTYGVSINYKGRCIQNSEEDLTEV